MVHFSGLLSMLDRCLEVRSGVLARSNANEQLALERLAHGIAEARAGAARQRPVPVERGAAAEREAEGLP